MWRIAASIVLCVSIHSTQVYAHVGVRRSVRVFVLRAQGQEILPSAQRALQTFERLLRGRAHTVTLVRDPSPEQIAAIEQAERGAAGSPALLGELSVVLRFRPDREDRGRRVFMGVGRVDVYRTGARPMHFRNDDLMLDACSGAGCQPWIAQLVRLFLEPT